MEKIYLQLKEVFENRVVLHGVNYLMQHLDCSNVFIINDRRDICSISGCEFPGMALIDGDCKIV